MKVSVKEILRPCNISDSGCETKLMRINDILSSFALQCFECYTMKHSQAFNVTNCETVIETKYPIARIRGFVGSGCSNCSIKPLDCCAGWNKLLVEQGWLEGGLDKNMYAIEFPNKVHLKLSGNVGRGLLIYSRGFDEVTSLDDIIEIDSYTLSLLRLFIKMEYALETDNDSTLTQLYSKKFTSRLEQINKAFGNHILMVAPGGAQIKAQF